jgi:CHAD domain-containing protein
MAANLSRRGRPASEARRVLRRQMGKARRELRDEGIGDETIHQVRRRIKQARATLRLMHDVLPRGRSKRIKLALRCAARPLGRLRDARVLLEALDTVARGQNGARSAGVVHMRRTLADDYLKSRASFSRRECRRVRKSLRKGRKAVPGKLDGGRDARPFVRAVERLYADSRGALEEVRREASVANLHRWRKLTKYLNHEVRLLLARSPQLAPFATQLHALTDTLGADHDLAMLRLRVAAGFKDFADPADAADLTARIERKRATLQQEALLRGARLFRVTPEVFARRLG